jgi:hypothetical protein
MCCAESINDYIVTAKGPLKYCVVDAEPNEIWPHIKRVGTQIYKQR